MERVAPNSLPVAATALHNIGGTFLQKGRVDEAQEYFHRALDLKECEVPNSFDVACTYHSFLGWLNDKRVTKGRNLVNTIEHLRSEITIRQTR